MCREDRSPLGRVYGVPSDELTHIGRPFRSFRKGVPYSKNESDLWHRLSVLMSILWLTDQITELVFLDSAEPPQFWKRVGDKEYHPELSHETREWQLKLVSRYRDFMTEAEAK